MTASIFTFDPIRNLSLSLETKYIGLQYIDNTSNSNRVLNPYLVNNFLIRYSIKTRLFKEIGLSLILNNFLNSMYESNAWVYRYYESGVEKKMDGYFPQAGFNMLAGLNLKF